MTHFDQQDDKSIVDDEDTVERIHSGSEEAFSQLFHAHYVDLVGYAESFLGSHEEAEEVVCELFVRIYEIRMGWEPGGSIRGYLFRAVRNRVMNQMRSRVREHTRNVLFTQEWYLENDSSLASVYSDLEKDEEDQHVMTAINRAIASLPARAREVVSLRWKEGMSDDMIAEIMDTTVAGVRMQASRALQTLRERLPRYLK